MFSASRVLFRISPCLGSGITVAIAGWIAALSMLPLAISEPAAAQAQDTTPSGMVAFFAAADPTTSTGCPAGWFVPPQAQGRLLVGVVDSGTVGITAAPAPMANATDPTHVHGYFPSITLAEQSIAGLSGGADHEGAHNGTYTLQARPGVASVFTNPSPSNLPFIQLIVCQKQ